MNGPRKSLRRLAVSRERGRGEGEHRGRNHDQGGGEAAEALAGTVHRPALYLTGRPLRPRIDPIAAAPGRSPGVLHRCFTGRSQQVHRGGVPEAHSSPRCVRPWGTTRARGRCSCNPT